MECSPSKSTYIYITYKTEHALMSDRNVPLQKLLQMRLQPKLVDRISVSFVTKITTTHNCR